MKKVFFNFQDPINSYPLNERGLGLMKPGRYKGYTKALKESSGVYKITHEPLVQPQISQNTLSNFTKRNLNLEGKVTSDKAVVINYGACIMPTGVVLHDSDEIRVNITQNNLNGLRYDLLVVSHEYLNIAGGQAPSYEIVVGITANELPSVPSLDKKICLGIFEVPSGDISTVNVKYEPMVAPMIGDLFLQNIIDLSISGVTLPEASTTKKGIVKLTTVEEAGTQGNNTTALTPEGFYNNKASINKSGITQLANEDSYKTKPVGAALDSTVTIGALHDNLPKMNNVVERLTSATYTLKPTDNGKIFVGSMGTNSTTVVTVPSGLPSQFHVGFMFGSSNVSVQSQGSSIIKKVNSEMRLVEIGSAMLLNSTGTTDQYILTGDLFDSRYNS